LRLWSIEGRFDDSSMQPAFRAVARDEAGNVLAEAVFEKTMGVPA
jgi:hypothetical protein